MQDVLDFFRENLRYNALKRLWLGSRAKVSEIAALIGFGVFFAFLDGLGLSLLLPILQFVESGKETALNDSSSFVWRAISWFMHTLGIPYSFVSLLILAFLPILFRQVVYYFRTWYAAVVAGRLSIRSRMAVMDIFFATDPDFYRTIPPGHGLNIIMTLSSAAGTALLAVVNFFTTLLLLLLYFAIMFALSAPITLCALIAGLLVVLVSQTNIKRIGQYSRLVADRSQEMMGRISEKLSLIRLIKMRDQAKQEKQNIEDYSLKMVEFSIKQTRLAATIEVTSQPLLMFSAFVTLFIGVALLDMHLAQIGLIIYILTQINARIAEANQQRQAIASSIASLSLLNETIDAALTQNSIESGVKEFTALSSSIVFEDVIFSYPDMYSPKGEPLSKGQEILKGVSLEIPAGSFTAFVGRSGAGKSTLVELLPRLHEVTGGLLAVDGVPVDDYKLGDLRRGMGYLTQHAMLFSSSIYDNLTYSLDHVPSDEEIRKALEDSHASFVYDLPQGLDTRLGDAGARFSGGERQRLAFARVLLQDASILILDEPTSALDSETESYIQDTLERLHGHKTIIVVAHRLATVMQADTLYVMRDGCIVEEGTHSELVSADGYYSTLFSKQLNGMIGVEKS